MKIISLIFILTLTIALSLAAFGDMPKYKVDADKCISCNLCVDKCPTGAIEMVDGKAVIDIEKCIGCAICVDGDQKDFAGCPTKAIAKIEKVKSTEEVKIDMKEKIWEKEETVKDSTKKEEEEEEEVKLTPCGKVKHCNNLPELR